MKHSTYAEIRRYNKQISKLMGEFMLESDVDLAKQKLVEIKALVEKVDELKAQTKSKH